MTNAIFQTHYDSLSDLVRSIGDRSSAVRAEAELDGLILAGDESVAIAELQLAEPQSEEAITAATLVAFALQETTLYPKVLNILCGENSELQTGARMGLRLSNIQSIVRELLGLAGDAQPSARIAILDVLSFHRVSVPVDMSSLLTLEDPDSRCLLMECLGRIGNIRLVASFSQDTDPKIKKAFWQAMARSGHPQVVDACRQRCIQKPPCHDAIRFMGVIGSPQDHSLLRQLASCEATATAAIEAMGILGATELIPDIVAAIDSPVTSQVAAIALERISGRMVPRSDPPPPPDHLTEEELDFWFHPGDPVPEAAHQWWRQSRYDFDAGKRYQAGRCVSDDPLGSIFDELPDEVRRDVYLRERALNFKQTPDWELDTWPWYLRNPGWALQSTS